ncbi:MAG TPA: hypothetical protein VF051_14515 [Hyphomicrobiaceae bacterium]|jgi:hypothetical protein
MRAIGRLIMVPLAFLLGTVAALFILFTLGMEKITHALAGRAIEADASQIFEFMRQASALASAATIVPAILLVIVGEVARIRSSAYYILGGGAALCALPLMAMAGSLSSDLSPLGTLWTVFATAGFAGGFVYWLLAGRNA